MSTPFELQGHRGARGLKPENTLPSFEAAFDHGVTAVETDLHLCADGAVIVCHDPVLTERWCSLLPAAAPLAALSREQIRAFRADRNPDPLRFPDQNATVTPVAALFTRRQGLDPFGVPTLADLFAFADAYAHELGVRAGKTVEQRERAQHVLFDLELKRIPFHPELIGDAFTGGSADRLEQAVVTAVRAAGVVGRTRVRSFDHRCVRALRELEPGIAGAVLLAETAVIDPAEVARRAGAGAYCPSYTFLDEGQVRQAHAGGVRVLPWTVNDPADWVRLLGWGVDGLTTDFPDRLAAFLRSRGVAF